MIMLTRSVLSVVVVFGAISLHARDLRPELVVQGRVNEISISPAGDLWFGSVLGRAYRSDDGGRTWAEASVPSRKEDPPTTWISDHLDRVTFFDARRAMVSGYIGEKQRNIFLTEDGGATWKAVTLPVNGFWVYDAQATADGHAWLVGSNGVVLRSDDFGRTWRALARPFKEDSERTHRVWFHTPLAGVVASLDGWIAVTRDGGASWSAFEAQGHDKVVSGCKDERDRRVNEVYADANRVIIEQCGGVYAAPLNAPRSWSRITANGSPVLRFGADHNRVIGVTEKTEVVEISPDESRVVGKRLERLPVHISVSGNRIAMIDATKKVSAYDGQKWLISRMFGKGVATSWPVEMLDRGAHDVLWGISEYFLYRSTDGAKSWDRITELPVAMVRIHLQRNGDVLLFDGHGWSGRWEVSASRLVNVPVLNGLDVAGSFRRDDVWLLFGGRQYDTARRVEVAQTFFSGQFAGSVAHGFVAASTDGGTTWSIIDRWDEGPQAIFLSDDNRLTLLSWLCGIRQGTITREPLAANMQTVLSGSERERTPYVQHAYVLDFLNKKNGWILGWIHHVGDVTHRTNDGGRSWKSAERNSYPRTALHRLADKTWIGVVPPSTLQRWNGTSFERLLTAPKALRWVWADSQGELSVQFEDGTVHVLDPQQRKLRALIEKH